MTAIDTAFALVIVGLLGCIGFFAVMGGRGIYRMRHPVEIQYETALCTPSRHASITASRDRLGYIKPTLPRRQLATWVIDYAVPTPDNVDEIKANSRSYDLASLTAPAEPELPPAAPVPVVDEEEQGIAVDWPTRVVQPVPLRR